MKPWSEQWFEDCKKWRGKVLEGQYRHWCFDWDELPVDETTSEFDCCNCFSCKCGARFEEGYEWGVGGLKYYFWFCPNRHWWNFWKHTKSTVPDWR